jgi:hypothetical protein
MLFRKAKDIEFHWEFKIIVEFIAKHCIVIKFESLQGEDQTVGEVFGSSYVELLEPFYQALMSGTYYLRPGYRL